MSRRTTTYIKTVLIVAGTLLFAACGAKTGYNNNTDMSDDIVPHYYLTIGDEGIYMLTVDTKGQSGGCTNADGSPFKKGENIYLEMLDGMSTYFGVTITAYDKDGNAVFEMMPAADDISSEENDKSVYYYKMDDWCLFSE